MNRPIDEDIEYVLEALRLGLKQNEERYPHMTIHMRTCSIVQIELLNWILGRGENPYPISKEIVELKRLRDMEESRQ